MAVLSSAFLLFTALSHNVLYIYKPDKVVGMDLIIENSIHKNMWLSMQYHPHRYDPVFSHHLPPPSSPNSTYMQYKVRLRFENGSVGETKWKFILLDEYKNVSAEWRRTQCETLTVDSYSNISDSVVNKTENCINPNPYLTYNLTIFIAIICIILLVHVVYDVSRSQFVVLFKFFNK